MVAPLHPLTDGDPAVVDRSSSMGKADRLGWVGGRSLLKSSRRGHRRFTLSTIRLDHSGFSRYVICSLSHHHS